MHAAPSQTTALILEVEGTHIDAALRRLRSGKTGEQVLGLSKTPMLDHIKAKGGVKPGSRLAGELNAMGVTNKSHPGLFNKKGIGEVDNLTPSEHPVLSEMPHDGTYSDSNSVLAAIENLEDQPARTSDRGFMIDTANMALGKLKEHGVDMTLADLQAVMWYYEKRLYGELGARQLSGISYEEIAKIVASGRTLAEANVGGQRVQRRNTEHTVEGPDGNIFSVDSPGQKGRAARPGDVEFFQGSQPLAPSSVEMRIRLLELEARALVL